MTTNNEFKETDIGDIPVEWDVEEIGDLYSSQYGYTESAKDEDTGTKFLRITDISENGQVKWNTVPYCEIEEKDLEKFKLETGDLLIARIGATTGKTCLINTEVEQGVFASYLIRLQRKNEKIVPSFGFYFTQSKFYWNQINANKGGKLKKGVSATLLKTLKVPIPPLPEQKTIAQKLTVIRNAIEQTQAVIEATEELKKSMMKHLFTYGPVPANQTDQVELKETDIGLVPKEWKLSVLSKFVEVKGGKRLPKGKSLVDYKTEHPYLRVRDFAHGTVSQKEIKYITEEIYPEISRYTISKDDLYISIAGTIGLVGEIPESLDGGNLTENAAKLILKSEGNLDKSYLKYFLLSSIGQSQIQLRTTKTSQPKLALMRIRQLPILLPPLNVQKQIADILKKIDDRYFTEKSLKESLETTFNSTLESLMSAKIRVN